MDKTFATYERIRALWQQLERVKPDSPEYAALAKQIRTESDVYNALVEEAAKGLPQTKRPTKT